MGGVDIMPQSAYRRIVWVDVCKGIGIILVVLGHTGSPFVRLIYSFHMLLFFIISGFLVSDKTYCCGDGG